MASAPRLADVALVRITDVDLAAKPFPLAVGTDNRTGHPLKIDLRFLSGIDHVPAVDEMYWVERRFGWWTIASYFLPETDEQWADWEPGSPITGYAGLTETSLGVFEFVGDDPLDEAKITVEVSSADFVQIAFAGPDPDNSAYLWVDNEDAGFEASTAASYVGAIAWPTYAYSGVDAGGQAFFIATATDAMMETQNPSGKSWKIQTDKGLHLPEQASDPSASSNAVWVYARDNGSGKTQLCVRGPTGSAAVLWTEP